MDANLLSWYANYFTRFMEAVASDEWRVNAKTSWVLKMAGILSARKTWCVAWSDGGEFAFAQIIIDATPADGVAGEAG
jgi:hypothetical protein